MGMIVKHNMLGCRQGSISPSHLLLGATKYKRQCSLDKQVDGRKIIAAQAFTKNDED